MSTDVPPTATTPTTLPAHRTSSASPERPASTCTRPAWSGG